MTRHAKAVLQEALNLPEEERAEIASLLLESLGPEPDVDVETAWRHEVVARMAEREAGTVKTTSWEEVRNQFIARLSERRQG